MALVDASRTKVLRDERIEREQRADAEHDSGKENRRSSADGADRRRSETRTMTVSTMPIVIQPSSATITGIASDNIARSSRARMIS